MNTDFKSFKRLRIMFLSMVLLAFAGGCMANSAYYLQGMSEYHSYDELQSAAKSISSGYVDVSDGQFTAKALPFVSAEMSELDFNLQDLFCTLTLSIVPQRTDRVRTWLVCSGNWQRKITIREIRHESLWPTGMIPAALGADARCVHCPDNNEAFRCEESFAIEIARALYILERNKEVRERENARLTTR